MTSRDERQTNVSIGFLNLLQILFLILKLTGTINWPWLWVLAPLIFETVMALILMIILVIVIILTGK